MPLDLQNLPDNLSSDTKELLHPHSPQLFQFKTNDRPHRDNVITEYQEEIDSMHHLQVDSSEQSEFSSAPSDARDKVRTLALVPTVVQHTLNRATVADDADLFSNGDDGNLRGSCHIQNAHSRPVGERDEDVSQRLPVDRIFSTPVIAALPTRVGSDIVRGPDAVHFHGPHEPQDLWGFVDRFSANFPSRPGNLVGRPPAKKDVVVITGTTGGFGCDALEHLLRDDTVERVYAFNRKDTDALERQRKQFSARGLDGALLNSPKFSIVEAVLHEPGFGIDAELVEEIRTSATHILLNAWRVNFNLPITSFEPDMQGVRNFIDLALSSPCMNAPVVMLVSSILVFRKWDISPVPEIPIDDPAYSFGAGYSESKWIAEHVLQNVTQQRGLHTVVMRLGQVAGDRMGYWNVREWFPSLVKSALFQKCLPIQDKKVTWIPSYEAAQAFVELRHSSDPIVHLVHPRPVPWHAVVAPIAQELDVPLVPFTEWLSKLEGSVEKGSAEEVEAKRLNPALRLLSFYKMQGEIDEGSLGGDAMGFATMGTAKAVRVSETLARLARLDEERAKMWLAAWRESGFLSLQGPASEKGKL